MSTAALTIESIDWDDVDAATRAELVALIGRSERPCPFFMPEFIDAYLSNNERYVRSEVHPFVMLARRPSRELVAALPLKSVRNMELGGYRQVEFIVATEVDLPSIIVAQRDEAEAAPVMAKALARCLKNESVIDLVNQAPASEFATCLPAQLPRHSRVQIDPGMPISHIPIQHATLGEYFADLSRRMRSNLARLGRRLAALGELELLRASSPQGLADAFDVYLDIEARSWKRGTEASLRRDPARVEMYRALHASATRVEHHVDIITLDGAPIAGLISIQLGPTVFLMETCYDERTATLSPSNLLILLSVERAITDGLNEVALHGHFEAHKERWQAVSTPTSEIRLVRRASVPGVRSTAANLARRIGRSQPEGSVPTGQRENAALLPDQLDATAGAALRARADISVMEMNELADRLPFALRAHAHA